MQISWSLIIVWLIIGALAGSFVGMIVKRTKKGYGQAANIGIGLVGALDGGVVFKVFNIDLGLSNIAFSLQDLVAAVIGSLIFLVVICIIRAFRG